MFLFSCFLVLANSSACSKSFFLMVSIQVSTSDASWLLRFISGGLVKAQLLLQNGESKWPWPFVAGDGDVQVIPSHWVTWSRQNSFVFLWTPWPGKFGSPLVLYLSLNSFHGFFLFPPHDIFYSVHEQNDVSVFWSFPVFYYSWVSKDEISQEFFCSTKWCRSLKKLSLIGRFVM